MPQWIGLCAFSSRKQTNLLEKLIVKSRELLKNLRSVKQKEGKDKLKNTSHLQEGKSILKTYHRVKKK